jgi:threonine synthase
MLICASNANNVLTDFIRTGTYDKRRPLLKTTSPSMDILVSSNLERLLYLLSGCDCDLVADLMQQLNTDGYYTVPEQLEEAISREFWAGCCDDADAAAAIGKVWNAHRYLCDPHTACGWAVAEDYVNQTGDKRPMVVLSTASPYKFPAVVLEAIGGDLSGDEFDQMERLSAATDVPVPANLATLRGKAERHLGVINKEEMLDFVLGL